MRKQSFKKKQLMVCLLAASLLAWGGIGAAADEEFVDYAFEDADEFEAFLSGEGDWFEEDGDGESEETSWEEETYAEPEAEGDAAADSEALPEDVIPMEEETAWESFFDEANAIFYKSGQLTAKAVPELPAGLPEDTVLRVTRLSKEATKEEEVTLQEALAALNETGDGLYREDNTVVLRVSFLEHRTDEDGDWIVLEGDAAKSAAGQAFQEDGVYYAMREVEPRGPVALTVSFADESPVPEFALTADAFGLLAVREDNPGQAVPVEEDLAAAGPEEEALPEDVVPLGDDALEDEDLEEDWDESEDEDLEEDWDESEDAEEDWDESEDEDAEEDWDESEDEDAEEDWDESEDEDEEEDWDESEDEDEEEDWDESEDEDLEEDWDDEDLEEDWEDDLPDPEDLDWDVYGDEGTDVSIVSSAKSIKTAKPEKNAKPEENEAENVDWEAWVDSLPEEASLPEDVIPWEDEEEEGTEEPSEEPVPEITEEPTPEPTEEPTPEPTEEPTPEITEEPTPEPTRIPTPTATPTPTREPERSGSAEIYVNLNLVGRSIEKEDQFTFTLLADTSTAADGSSVATPMPGSTNVRAESAEALSFGSIRFSKAGTYNYKVIENVPSGASFNSSGQFEKDGIVYDSTQHKVQVRVAEAGTDKLTATVFYDGVETGTLTFTNTYAANQESISSGVITPSQEIASAPEEETETQEISKGSPSGITLYIALLGVGLLALLILLALLKMRK